ncbi:hypothetical protein GGS21DRAFT_535291 [Xylaria nigripes]|nr:hypothetical protein GGS21DRAFT_535291 [Xylaria nigripes]
MTSFYYISIEQLMNLIKAEQHLLNKAEAFAAEKGIPIAELMDTRFAPDMWPFSHQISISCVHTVTFVQQATGHKVNTVTPGPATFEVCKKHLAETLQTLEAVKPEDVNGKEKDILSAHFGGGQHVDMRGIDYVVGYLMTNLLFHLTTIYDMLRWKGATLIKADYVAPFIRLP